MRHLLSEHFDIDRLAKTPSEPKDFPENFGPDEKPGDWAHKNVTEELVRFAAIYGQMLMSGHDDPSFGRMERWNRLLIDQANRTRDELEADEKNVFPRGSLHYENPDKEKCGTWTPPSSRPEGSNCENFSVEPDPAKPGDTTGFRVLIMPEFVSELTKAVQKYNAHPQLYRQVFFGLRREGVGKRVNGPAGESTIYARQLAAVTERLIADGADATDPYIGLLVTTAIANLLGGGHPGGPGGPDSHFSAFAIDLPDLDAGTHVEIIPDNLNAVRVIYYSAQLEEMKLYATVDTIVEHATTGMLPVSRGVALDRLYQWIKLTPRRINEIERRGLYARVLGLAQGPVQEPLPNREFSDMWLRFLSTVSQKFREISSTDRELVSVEQIHKAGRDLAVNLSLHGYGVAHPAAIELQELLREVIDMLSDPEILRAYGVRDIWQLTDRVSALYLGGAVNGVRYRTMATSGEKIIAWLAGKAPILASASAVGLRVSVRTATGPVATNDFRRLAELAERWLAVTGTADLIAERHTDPVDLQVQTTVPMLGQNIALPQSVQDTLEQVGVNVPDLAVIPPA